MQEKVTERGKCLMDRNKETEKKRERMIQEKVKDKKNVLRATV